MKRIIYLPLEPLQERYTIQLSAAKTGWLERRWIENNVPYVRIEGKTLTTGIETGAVLDAHGRGFWALSQVMRVLRMLHCGEITSDDVIYFDDFWHPGISALPYCFEQTNVKPKMFAMLHAQSVDPHDFTYCMRNWMRYFEQGIGRCLAGIFVTSTCLQEAVVKAGIGRYPSEECTEPELGQLAAVHLAGLPFNSEEVKEHWTSPAPVRQRQVIFSSRWDSEKNPDFFLQVAAYCILKDPSIKFVVTTSAKKLRSNNPDLLDTLQEYIEAFPHNIELRENQTKEQYYHNLRESKVQMNTADQDFVSWTLLEATLCGCVPVYPEYLSFPEALGFDARFLYEKNNVKSAAMALFFALDVLPTGCADHVYQKYDRSWQRMLNVMNNQPYEALY